MTMSIGNSVIFIEEMWLWGEMARLDRTLHIYDAVFHSH
jgi:hypothetical protein